MRVVFIVAVISLSLGTNGSEIESQYVADVINLRLKDQNIDMPKEFLNALSLEIKNSGSRIGGITAVVNDYADQILANIRTLITNKGLDPMKLPNTTLKLIPTGTIALSNGWLQDTSSLSRNGNVTVTYSSTTKSMVFNVPIKFDSLMFSYDYLTKVLLINIKGEAHGKVENLKIDVQLGFDYETDQASLDHFDIANTGKFSLKFTGNGLIDWITNTMTSLVTTFLHPVIVQIIQSIVKGGLENAVNSINSFIESILHPETSSVATLL